LQILEEIDSNSSLFFTDTGTGKIQTDCGTATLSINCVLTQSWLCRAMWFS
jgi:hypothetical protein